MFDPAAARAFLRMIAEGRIEIGSLAVMEDEPVDLRVRERLAV
jgi:hypothetical protein